MIHEALVKARAIDAALFSYHHILVHVVKYLPSDVMTCRRCEDGSRRVVQDRIKRYWISRKRWTTHEFLESTIILGLLS